MIHPRQSCYKVRSVLYSLLCENSLLEELTFGLVWSGPGNHIPRKTVIRSFFVAVVCLFARGDCHVAKQAIYIA